MFSLFSSPHFFEDSKMDSNYTSVRQRVICIDLDDETDAELDTNEDNPQSELSVGVQNCVEQCLISDDELDIELIDELVFEGEPTTDSKIVSYHSMDYSNYYLFLSLLLQPINVASNASKTI